jgi:hypothetical protein
MKNLLEEFQKSKDQEEVPGAYAAALLRYKKVKEPVSLEFLIYKTKLQ